MFLLFFYSPGYGWIGTSPRVFFKPPFLSVAIFFDKFPGTTFFQSIDILLLLCAVFITLGIKSKLSSIAYCVISMVALSFQYSLGKIDHNILLYVMIFCMAFSGWGSSLALVPDKAVSSAAQNKCLSALAFILCFAFFTAGFNKALNWINLDFNKSGTALWVYANYYITFRQYLLADFLKGMPFYNLKIMDYLGVAFEVSPLLFLLRSKKAWGTWLLIAALFHLTTLLFLNIAFLTHVIIYATFIDFSKAYNWVKNLLAKRVFRAIAIIILGVCVSVRVYDIFKFKTSKLAFIADFYAEEILIVSLVIWILMLILLYNNAFKSKRPIAVNSL